MEVPPGIGIEYLCPMMLHIDCRCLESNHQPSDWWMNAFPPEPQPPPNVTLVMAPDEKLRNRQS